MERQDQFLIQDILLVVAVEEVDQVMNQVDLAVVEQEPVIILE
tara:strand:+ start:531 stop:659 length:129 start_codon:yes stop_codon:yes gene_type:complete